MYKWNTFYTLFNHFLFYFGSITKTSFTATTLAKYTRTQTNTLSNTQTHIIFSDYFSIILCNINFRAKQICGILIMWFTFLSKAISINWFIVHTVIMRTSLLSPSFNVIYIWYFEVLSGSQSYFKFSFLCSLLIISLSGIFMHYLLSTCNIKTCLNVYLK